MDEQQPATADPGNLAETPQGDPTATQAKPLGVVLLALGVAFVGFLGLISGISLLALAFSGQITDLVTELEPADATSIALALGWAYVFEGGLALIVAYGLFALRAWAWLFALVLLGWRMAASVFAWLTGSLIFGWAALQVVVAGLLIAYLLSRDVKAAFARDL